MNEKCKQCKNSGALGFDISMAFQPIVDLHKFDYYAYEALVRGTKGEGAFEIFKHVNQDNQYFFDQTCRTKAIELAAKLSLSYFLSINFMPNAVYEPSKCIQSTLQAAHKYNFPLDKLVFEFTEQEQVVDHSHLANIVNNYKQRGFLTAIDDFGAGFSGLKILCDVNVDVVKIDRDLIIDIHLHPRRQRILRGMFGMLNPVVNRIVVEGIEKEEELRVLYAMGFRFFQGYYFAKPGFEKLPTVDFDALRTVLNEKRHYLS
jgi:EAL domain-containing protein (putative c-di-GMP-specific phosphodiesterase class I)